MLFEDETTGDLNVSAGSLDTIDEQSDQTGQRVLSRIRTVKGEWFLDTVFGLDYRNAIWNKQTSVQARDAHIQRQILLSAAPGSKIKKYNTELDSVNRTLSIDADVLEPGGEVISLSLEI